MTSLCFWDRLTGEEKAEVTRFGRERRYHTGDRILSEMDKDDWTGVILGGKCRVTGSREDGTRTYLAARRTGDVIGEMAAARGARRCAEVTAVTPVRLHVLSGVSFQQLLELHPGILRHLLSVALERLYEADEYRADLTYLTTELRLSRLLLRLVLAEGVRSAGATGFTLGGVTQLELADWCGISRKSVQRHLKTLTDRGVLQAGGGQRQLTVLDMQELRTRALVAPSGRAAEPS